MSKGRIIWRNAQALHIVLFLLLLPQPTTSTLPTPSTPTHKSPPQIVYGPLPYTGPPDPTEQVPLFDVVSDTEHIVPLRRRRARPYETSTLLNKNDMFFARRPIIDRVEGVSFETAKIEDVLFEESRKLPNRYRKQEKKGVLNIHANRFHAIRFYLFRYSPPGDSFVGIKIKFNKREHLKAEKLQMRGFEFGKEYNVMDSDRFKVQEMVQFNMFEQLDSAQHPVMFSFTMTCKEAMNLMDRQCIEGRFVGYAFSFPDWGGVDTIEISRVAKSSWWYGSAPEDTKKYTLRPIASTWRSQHVYGPLWTADSNRPYQMMFKHSPDGQWFEPYLPSWQEFLCNIPLSQIMSVVYDHESAFNNFANTPYIIGKDQFIVFKVNQFRVLRKALFDFVGWTSFKLINAHTLKEYPIDFDTKEYTMDDGTDPLPYGKDEFARKKAMSASAVKACETSERPPGFTCKPIPDVEVKPIRPIGRVRGATTRQALMAEAEKRQEGPVIDPESRVFGIKGFYDRSHHPREQYSFANANGRMYTYYLWLKLTKLLPEGEYYISVTSHFTDFLVPMVDYQSFSNVFRIGNRYEPKAMELCSSCWATARNTRVGGCCKLPHERFSVRSRANVARTTKSARDELDEWDTDFED